ncbi:MAG: MarR family transcriptional regulator [Actinobacteria bacterium]|nr:MarR family transcriptional regulator [Actinomycetota bacterium]
MADHLRSETSRGVPAALGRLRVALNDSYTDASRELGLTPQQAELLCLALRPRPVGDLARLLHCDRSNVSRLVDRAAARGLLARRGEQHDGRVSLIELSPAGEQLARQFLARLETLTQPLLANWTEGQREDAANVLDALAGAIEQAPREAGSPQSA